MSLSAIRATSRSPASSPPCKSKGFYISYRSVVKNLPANEGDAVSVPGLGRSAGGAAKSRTHWATLLWLFTFIHWRRKWQSTPVFLPGESQGWGEPGGLPSMGPHRVGHDWRDLAAAAAGEGNGYPLQYSCLGSPMDRGTRQAAVHGVAKESDTTERLNNTK